MRFRDFRLGGVRSHVSVGEGPLRSTANALEEPGHLHGHLGTIFANVVPSEILRSGERLIQVLHGENTESHWNTGLELRILDTPGTLASHRFVVGCFPPDHATKTDHGIDAPGLPPSLGGQREFKGSRYPVLGDITNRHTRRGEAAPNSVEEAQGDV